MYCHHGKDDPLRTQSRLQGTGAQDQNAGPSVLGLVRTPYAERALYLHQKPQGVSYASEHKPSVLSSLDFLLHINQSVCELVRGRLFFNSDFIFTSTKTYLRTLVSLRFTTDKPAVQPAGCDLSRELITSALPHRTSPGANMQLTDTSGTDGQCHFYQ